MNVAAWFLKNFDHIHTCYFKTTQFDRIILLSFPDLRYGFEGCCLLAREAKQSSRNLHTLWKKYLSPSLRQPAFESSRFLQNVCKFLPRYIASHLKKQYPFFICQLPHNILQWSLYFYLSENFIKLYQGPTYINSYRVFNFPVRKSAVKRKGMC